jgi:hypothetical protein
VLADISDATMTTSYREAPQMSLAGHVRKKVGKDRAPPEMGMAHESQRHTRKALVGVWQGEAGN